MDSQLLKAKAEEFIQSYAAAMHTAPNATPEDCGAALASHYDPGFTFFTFSHKHTSPHREDAGHLISQGLKTLVAIGLGCDIRLRKSRVETFTKGSALCYVTWEVFPKSGNLRPWCFENL